MSTYLLALVIAGAMLVPSAHAQVGIRLNADGSITGSNSSTSTIEINGGTGTATIRATSTNTTDGSKDSEREQTGLLKNSLGVEIRAAADVMTDEDLDSFEENLLITDAHIADADSSNKRVGVSYWHEGRLLGVFPVKVQSRTDAHIGEEDTLTLKTSMPWWSFLVMGLGNVKKDVKAELMGNDQFQADVLLSADAKARARALEAIATAHANMSVKD